MSNKENISFDEVKAFVGAALREFYIHDGQLLEYDTMDAAVAERCMVFHIGWYMLDLLRSTPKLSWANIDCEYNRNFAHPKSMYMQTLKGIREKIKDAVPDLLIHRRRSNEDNLLVIEFKKGKAAQTGIQNDEQKLEYFTNLDKNTRHLGGVNC